MIIALAGLPAAALPHRAPADAPLVLHLGLQNGRSFRPDDAIGAALDGTEKGGVERIFTPVNIAAMRRAGLRSLTYRLRTELGIESWHWNPVGRWSDPAHRQGYWTSSDRLRKPIRLSWGYNLPRRGDTEDQANDAGYSRLTDGDPATYRKSNPYLDPMVLRDGVAHPQWLVVRLDRRRPIDTAVIDWGTPFARRYLVQYWTGEDEDDGSGRWVTFPGGQVTSGRGGTVRLSLARQAIATRDIRVLLDDGSGTAPAGSSDWRDRAGFAVREVSFGVGRRDGSLADAVIHAPSHARQTFTHVSSTDPWHRATDRDHNLEQPGIDRVLTSPLTFGRPAMVPTGLLYDTPADIRSELRYIARRRYRVGRVELGEEPDGQYASAADYGALYLAAFDRLKGILPHAKFGGPSLQSATTDTWMQPGAPHSWDAWLVRYLERRRRLADMQFLSFEFYPFDDICGDPYRKLIEQTAMLRKAWSHLDESGWPKTTPRIISEYGFSAYAGRAESEMPSALLMADIVGQWLTLGGDSAYMFGYPPNRPATSNDACAGYGNMMLFEADPAGRARQPMPPFYAARLLTRAWTMPDGAAHRVIDTAIEGNARGDVEAFALQRPDGRRSVLLVNRSASRERSIWLRSRPRHGRDAWLSGPATLFSYGPAQYSWIDRGRQSHPGRDRAPVSQHLASGPLRVRLAPASIEVLVIDRHA